MTKTILSTLCATILVVALHADRASGQAAAQPARIASPIAILDLPFIFRNHIRFKQAQEALNQEIATGEQQFAAEATQLKEFAKTLETLKPGTEDYKRREEELVKKDSDMALRVNIAKKNFTEKRAKIYYEVYNEVMGFVKYYADSQGIVLVLQFNGDPIDANNAQSVMQGLTSTVLYKHDGVDITPIIRDWCNQQVPAPAAQQQVPVTGNIGVPPR